MPQLYDACVRQAIHMLSITIKNKRNSLSIAALYDVINVQRNEVKDLNSH